MPGQQGRGQCLELLQLLLTLAFETLFVTELGAHRFIQTSWPESLSNPSVSAPQYMEYKKELLFLISMYMCMCVYVCVWYMHIYVCVCMYKCVCVCALY